MYYDLCTTLKLMWLSPSFQCAETWSFDYCKVKSHTGLSITRKGEELILFLPREVTWRQLSVRKQKAGPERTTHPPPPIYCHLLGLATSRSKRNKSLLLESYRMVFNLWQCWLTSTRLNYLTSINTKLVIGVPSDELTISQHRAFQAGIVSSHGTKLTLEPPNYPHVARIIHHFRIPRLHTAG